MRRVLALLVLAAALAAAGGAAAVGPSLWVVNGRPITNAASLVSYVARPAGSGTVLRAVAKRDGRVSRSVRLPGAWGFQAVTVAGEVAGLSANGRVLVLQAPAEDPGALRSRTALEVVRTRDLAVTRRIRLRGDFTVDALSPNGRTLYLIQHVDQASGNGYRVRAYDLRAGKLLRRVIADKRQAGWTMRGMPIGRAATRSEAKVFTLYQAGDNYPFVHALDAAHGTAVCIGLPVSWGGNALDGATLRLDRAERRLTVAGPHLARPLAIDVRTLRLVRP